MGRDMLRHRNGQASGGSAATLVAIIAGIILLYILFLPPADRERLLEGNLSDNDADNDDTEIERILMIEDTGRLDYTSENEIIHNIPSINLFTSTQPEIIKKISSLYVKNGWFDKESADITFHIDDVVNTANLKLTFNLDERKGKLSIALNGNEIFNSDVSSSNIDPIELHKNILDTENKLVFSVSEVGWKFWETNEYQLSNIMISADVTDISSQESKSVFLVTSTEKKNIKSATLKFNPDCVQSRVGTLDVYLNNHNVFSAIPDCNMLTSIDFSTTYMLNGENRLVFKTQRGQYLIDQISVKSEMSEIRYPVYYFSIDNDEWTKILDDKLDVNLTIEFVDDIEYKKAKLVINGIETHIDQDERVYSKLIDNYVQKGNNAIEIIPGTVLDIIKITTFLQKN